MIELDFSKNNGLVTAVVVDADNNEVLMVAHMNREAFEETLRTGFAHYWSRSRQKLWRKGEISGNTQQVIEIYVDCDADSVLLKVKQIGPACHKGYRSCFHRKVIGNELKTIAERIADPDKMYGKSQ